MATTKEPVYFSPMTKEKVCLEKEILNPSKLFFQTPLPARLNDFEIKSYGIKTRPHDDFIYLMSFPSFLKKCFGYLVYHFSENGEEECVAYFLWADNQWHVTTVLPNYEPGNKDRWNQGIILLS